jgi:putative ABC transport system ATP-binding protein
VNAPRAPAIETRGLGKVYSAGTEAEVVALRDVDLRIGRGDFVAIMGPSGSGKSTLMNLIGCLDTPTSGTYACDGVDVATLDAEQLAILRRDKIGFVFQGFNLLPRMSALDNVAMPLGYARVPPAERQQRAHEALVAVGLGARASHRPSELSGGQQQRVAIARALINRPPILLADEPTGALDSKTGEEILDLFKRLRDDDHTVILITHDAEVAAHADRTFVMRDGELHAEAGDDGRKPGVGEADSRPDSSPPASRLSLPGPRP